MVTSFMLLTPQWLLPNRLILEVGDAVILNRLQIGHTRATHAHLLGGDDGAFCTTCHTSLTVNHILIECPQFNHLRQLYNFGSTLKGLFNNTSVNDISLGFNNLFLLEY